MVTLIVCGILESELKKVVQELETPLDIVIMPPQLHNDPSRLKRELEHQLGTIKNTKKVIYGKCFPGIDDVVKEYGAERIEGENCYEIVAGDLFRNLLREEPGTYFLLPHLCETFDELTGELHIKELKNTYFKNYRRCVFLDTGVPCTTCEKVASKLGLPLHTVYTGTKILEERVKTLLAK